MTAISRPIPRFEITQVREGEKNFIDMYSDDIAFLREKGVVIADYTKKLYPQRSLSEIKIDRIDYQEKMAKKGLVYSISLDKILPPLVSALYGANRANRTNSNCHGAALVAAGLFPAMSYFSNPLELKIIAEKSDEVTFDQLACGDVVYLYSNRVFAHSFVFLDHDISLSMNGVESPFILHKTSKILTNYMYPQDCLTTPPKNFPMKILRKKGDWHYPEEVISGLTTFYNFADHYESFSKPDIGNYFKAQECAMLLQSYALQPHLASSEKQAACQIFHSVIDNLMPSSIIDNSTVPRL